MSQYGVWHLRAHACKRTRAHPPARAHTHLSTAGMCHLAGEVPSRTGSGGSGASLRRLGLIAYACVRVHAGVSACLCVR